MVDPIDVHDALLGWFKTAGRSVPMRNGASPWAILVAEVMSQQTQIERVGPAWKRFLEYWPGPNDLAGASTKDLLQAWAGPGYNRRALALRSTAQRLVGEHDGRLPTTVTELERLPGV